MFDKLDGISIFLSLSHYAMRVILLIYFSSGVYHASECLLIRIEDSYEDIVADNFGHVTMFKHAFHNFVET